MKTKFKEDLEHSFKQAINILESLRNTINRPLIDFDDLNLILFYFKDAENPDFIKLITFLKNYLDLREDKLLEKVESELAKIKSKYYKNFNKIYIVDNEFIYHFPSEVILHVLAAIKFGKNKNIHVSFLKSLKPKIEFKSKIYATINNFRLNLNFFDSDVLNTIPAEFNIEAIKISSDVINITDSVKIIQFLLDISNYKNGDQVFSMKSDIISKNGKKRWKQNSFSEIIQTKSERKHYVELKSDDEIIYRSVEGPSKMSESVTKQFEKINNVWNEIKVLQSLIG